MLVIASLAFIVIILFLTLGIFITSAQKPVKSDIIVSLGGGDGRRIYKALELYNQGYALKGKFLYTGREIVNPALPSRFSKSKFLLQHGVKKENIVYVPRGVIVNTAEELFFIRDYMLCHGYKSVLIISSPVHTRRIRMLAHFIAKYDKYNLSLCTSAFSPNDFNSSLYFLDPNARSSVFLEFEKLIYNLLKYSPLTIKETSYYRKKDSKMWQEKLGCNKEKISLLLH